MGVVLFLKLGLRRVMKKQRTCHRHQSESSQRMYLYTDPIHNQRINFMLWFHFGAANFHPAESIMIIGINRLSLLWQCLLSNKAYFLYNTFLNGNAKKKFHITYDGTTVTTPFILCILNCVQYSFEQSNPL
jgi:hypothetical protein